MIPFHIMQLTVKRMYWIQVPTKFSPKAKHRSDYWKSELAGVPMINPNDSYRKIACNKSMSLRIRSIAHQFINLELHFGPQATHMHTIKHLGHCQRCFPHKDCDCNDCKRPARTCTCSCHHPNAPLNNPHHMAFNKYRYYSKYRYRSRPPGSICIRIQIKWKVSVGIRIQIINIFLDLYPDTDIATSVFTRILSSIHIC